MDEVFPQFFGALFIAPISDPDEITSFRLTLTRVEGPQVRRFMPYIHLLSPAALFVGLLERIAVREDRVVLREIEAGQLVRSRNGAVVRVVKQQPKVRVMAGILADS